MTFCGIPDAAAAEVGALDALFDRVSNTNGH